MMAARARSEAYAKSRREYEAGRVDDPARQAQVRAAARRYRQAASGKTRPPKRQAARFIVGVDGEGEDYYVCRRCKQRTSSVGGACPRGGKHVVTLGCTRCGKRKASALEICGEGGKHDLHPVADGHIYTYLAAVSEHGRLVAEAHNPKGLSHHECAEMLLAIPKNTLKFGFMFSYDVTKICEQMPASAIYRLMRPKARERTVCKNKECKAILPRHAKMCDECGGEKLRKSTEPLEWNGRNYDFFNGSFTISDRLDGRDRTTKVWDCFRFFGCAFVEALKNWSGCKAPGCGGLMARGKSGFLCNKCGVELKDFGLETPVASVEQIERIDEMKQKRGAFDQEDPQAVKNYCREECHLLARMMRRLIDAHEKAEIPLQRYDGAGSTASALLRKYEVALYKGERLSELDPDLARAVACSFFGGRFEDSVVGRIARPVHGFDISSAYPFALTSLPCLACGFWRFEKKMTLSKLAAIQKKGGLAVSRYFVRHLAKAELRDLAWGPLPFRSEKGSISYGTNFSGWAWGPELLSALRGWSDIVQLSGEAWVYENRCDHRPFAFLPDVYRKRLAWGKEGAGIVLKLGMNASYGKTAQSIGDDPPFQSWVWAGMVTAITRGQLLDGIASAKDRWNVLAVATDGIFSLEELPLKAPPYDTGTGDLMKDGKPVPLGGWEHKVTPEGLFIAKPGLYYSLNQESPKAFVRARGVGRREVKTAFDIIQKGFAAWDRRDMDYHVVLRSRRFYGAKYSVDARSMCTACGKSWAGVPDLLCRTEGCSNFGQVGDGFKTSLKKTDAGLSAYGTWDVRTIQIGFDPHPKRERSRLSKSGEFAYLEVRDLDGAESAPYDVGSRRTTPEGEMAREAKDFALQQPDWDD